MNWTWGNVLPSRACAGYSREKLQDWVSGGQLLCASERLPDLRAGHFAKRLQAIDKLWRCLGPLKPNLERSHVHADIPTVVPKRLIWGKPDIARTCSKTGRSKRIRSRRPRVLREMWDKADRAIDETDRASAQLRLKVSLCLHVRFRGKADMAFHYGMSANDPKRTSADAFSNVCFRHNLCGLFPSCNTSAILDAIRRDVAPTRLVTSLFLRVPNLHNH